jgi:hypothetical protein
MALVTAFKDEKNKIGTCINDHPYTGCVQVKTEIQFVLHDQEYPLFSIISENWNDNIDYL